MARILLCKIAIAAYLCYQGYTVGMDDILFGTMQALIEMNVNGLDLQAGNAAFLKLYLWKVIIFCHVYSVMMVISQKIAPKVINMIGVLLWLYFHRHPQAHQGYFERQRMLELVCVVGGLLYLIAADSS